MMRIRFVPVQFRMALHGRTPFPWQTLIAAAYGVLLGAILPFICWGAWAEPGHPHGGPHFVFADPPAIHTHVHLVSEPHAHGETATDAVAGQAHPDSTLVIASLLMLMGTAIWLMRPRTTRATLAVPLAKRDHFPRIPTPPPRFFRLHVQGCALVQCGVIPTA